jgi:hypothetical protein
VRVVCGLYVEVRHRACATVLLVPPHALCSRCVHRVLRIHSAGYVKQSLLSSDYVFLFTVANLLLLVRNGCTHEKIDCKSMGHSMDCPTIHVLYILGGRRCSRLTLHHTKLI